MPEHPHRRLAAIVAADVADYSRLIGLDEEGTLGTLREVRRDIVDPLLSEHGGRVANTAGDSLLVEFPSVVNAVRCSLAMQRAMADRNTGIPHERRFAFRIGINVGDVVSEGEDLLGDGVNVAARLESLADAGGIALSDDAYRQVRDRVDAPWDDAGEHELKNIARPVRVWRWIQDAEAAPARSDGISGAMPTPNKPSIAVLPFDNMSGDPDQQYFSDGMVEEIIIGLSRIRWLTVIARNSTFAYKGTAPDVRQVGRELNVRYVLEGSVRKSGNRVRISGQLIEAETGGHLWADRFDGTLADVFDLEDQITAGVVAAIEPSVRRAEIERAKRKRPDNLDAYDLYLRALEQVSAFTVTGRAAALPLLEAAVELDPGYAEAHGLAAWCLMQRFRWEGRSPADREAALRHAEAVAQAQSDDATTLAFAAHVIGTLGDRPEPAMAMVERALAQNPSSATAHTVSALLNLISGRHELTLHHAERALQLSPFDALRYIPEMVVAAVKWADGKYETALANARRSLEASPAFPPGLIVAALCLVRCGRLEEARATVLRLLEVAPETQLGALHEVSISLKGLDFDRVVADLRAAGLPE